MHGVDYQETFAPIVKMNSILVLLSLAAFQNWPLLQFDIKNVFFYGDLDRDVSMKLSPNFQVASGMGKVCKRVETIT